MKLKTLVSITALAGMMATAPTFAASAFPLGGDPVPPEPAGWCDDFDYAAFSDAVGTAYTETNQFGFGLPMWATAVDNTGKVCAVYSVKGGDTPVANGGADAGNNAWLGSRVISAQKANTANAFSLDILAISTGAISVTVYPGGSLYGLQFSNPVNPTPAYAGSPENWGTDGDEMNGQRIGGVNVFGGGVAVYNDEGVKIGAVGASGDTSCRDHTLAYRLRINMGLNNQPNDDGLAFVASPAGLFQQPACGVNDPTTSPWTSGPDDFGARPAPVEG